MKLFIFVVCFAILPGACYSEGSSTAILIKKPGSFYLASKKQKLISFGRLVSDCFRNSKNYVGEVVEISRINKIINQRIAKSDKPPVIHCNELVSAYLSETK